MIFGNPPIVTNGLVLHLDAGSRKSYVSGSTTWTDLSGTGNNGTLINGPTFNSTNQGSIVFNGTTNFISSSVLTPFSSATPHTFTAWVRQTSFGSPYRWVIDNGTGSLGSSLALNSTKVDFFWNGGSNRVSSNGDLTTNTWFNIATSYSGLAVSFYINGSFDSTKATTAFSAGTIPSYIGAWRTNNYFFVGNIAVAQIYNRALSATEVQQNYNALKSRFGLS